MLLSAGRYGRLEQKRAACSRSMCCQNWDCFEFRPVNPIHPCYSGAAAERT